MLPANPSFGEAPPRSAHCQSWLRVRTRSMGATVTRRVELWPRFGSLGPVTVPSSRSALAQNGLLHNVRGAVFCYKRGNRGCMISIGCPGLKTNTQMFVFARFHGDSAPFQGSRIQRTAFLRLTCLSCSPPFWQKKGEPSTEPLVPRTLSKLIFGS